MKFQIIAGVNGILKKNESNILPELAEKKRNRTREPCFEIVSVLVGSPMLARRPFCSARPRRLSAGSPIAAAPSWLELVGKRVVRFTSFFAPPQNQDFVFSPVFILCRLLKSTRRMHHHFAPRLIFLFKESSKIGAINVVSR